MTMNMATELHGVSVAEAAPDGAPSMADYNYRHFRTEHLWRDAVATVQGTGIQPGEPAPDWELPLATGGTLRLSDFRGRPVLLHFGSAT